jgi:hypothetical protein
VIDRKVAKELLHVRDWLDRAQEIVDRGKEIDLREDLLQEAGDSLMSARPPTDCRGRASKARTGSHGRTRSRIGTG